MKFAQPSDRSHHLLAIVHAFGGTWGTKVRKAEEEKMNTNTQIFVAKYFKSNIAILLYAIHEYLDFTCAGAPEITEMRQSVFPVVV
eukprot:3922166-Amphidinium_carterae.1